VTTVRVIKMDDKMATQHNEQEKTASEIENGSDMTKEQEVERVPTVDIDNYHGLHAKTVLVYLVRRFPLRSSPPR
jgi:hypothetical protein